MKTCRSKPRTSLSKMTYGGLVAAALVAYRNADLRKLADAVEGEIKGRGIPLDKFKSDCSSLEAAVRPALIVRKK